MGSVHRNDDFRDERRCGDQIDRAPGCHSHAKDHVSVDGPKLRQHEYHHQEQIACCAAKTRDQAP
jgi:hypothetical protein